MFFTWRLFASVLAISDTGSLALTSEHSDWASERACRAAVQQIYATPRQQPLAVGGHQVTVKMNATCLQVVP
ncbi:hypothetical protein [Bradyrhizobium neotropicale]|uniref:hypothetical protein n=1 Tax=Bradyrhizobium neotropicale TaxID=1497615 RepID=UPI001AD6DFC3|nr:hypothetical protein [Bradyrhizobium neotropicale]MBO4221976.1 hypothetical protein [Bradyrhizobium neotropicale]